jgi:hypothetical protein
MTSRTSAISVDDLHDDDARSLAASSYVSSHISARPPAHNAAAAKELVARRATFEISRESSKESSNSESDEQLEQRGRELMRSQASHSSLSSEASRLSQPPAGRAVTPPLPHSPTSRRSTRLMVKSYSQDAPNDIGKGSIYCNGGRIHN